jgi:anti-sigma factor RsiW
MKKCDHFKDWILTGYIDGELNNDSTMCLESHLLDCRDCRAFLKEVNAVRPWKQARQPAPAELWDAIKHRIEQEDQAVVAREDIIGKFKGMFVFPRLVPVFASLILMLLAGSVTLNTIQVQQAREKDQGEYLVSLLSPAEESALSDNNDGGTPIEHYFL